MSSLFHSTETIGARLVSYSCPSGTAGRIHAQRLRRRFQSDSRPRSIASRSIEHWITGYDGPTPEISSLDHCTRQEQQPQAGKVLPSDVHIRPESESSLQTAFDDAISRTANDEEIPRLRVRKVRWEPPPYLIKASHGDTVGMRTLGSRYNAAYNSYSDVLYQALQTESPHAIINALSGFMKTSQNKMQGHDAFRMLSPNTFTEILRCLDPEYFVGRYIDLHKNNVTIETGAFTALRLQTEKGIHRFCVNFMARINMIIEARRSNGGGISLSDYKHLLRCAGAVENPKASQAIWRAMRNDGVEPDTDCFNYYLSGILKIGISNGTQRSELRSSYHVQHSGPKEYSAVFRGYYEKLGIDFKYETTKMFDDMLERGVAGDERTFCLLMIASARMGDVEAAKAILDRVWGINVNKLMTMNENDFKGPNSYSMDSPLRPSNALLLALVHCFGINNMVSTALRLVDYVSQRYSLPIPMEVWEDLLGVTYALSKPGTTDGETRKRRRGSPFLQPEAVSTLWSVLTAEPFNVKPNMAMYDRLIVNLLRRQRFGEAKKRIEEARKVHIGTVYEYEKTVAIEKFQSSFFDGRDKSEELEPLQGTTAYESYLRVQRDKTFQHLTLKHSRQYLYRWCRILIKLGSRSLLENPTFISKDLPRFIYDYRLFMPHRIEYPISTGYLSFPSGSAQLSKTLALEKEARSWSPHKADSIGRAKSLDQSTIEHHDMDEAYGGENFISTSKLDLDLDSEETFGKC